MKARIAYLTNRTHLFYHVLHQVQPTPLSRETNHYRHLGLNSVHLLFALVSWKVLEESPYLLRNLQVFPNRRFVWDFDSCLVTAQSDSSCFRYLQPTHQVLFLLNV
ncbi:hypothetical protein HanXRQr2_Chr17g0798711 [Helianthus annuus]|uniref:Uncharacterized protein n=1 Tax=Helianthus annuus TaxID=4232 RepID=A0A9K3DGD2_HELAN|nr:hypothetical protein HanXRQr2_Chr17g0798711 [Helianthus annuus]KAJ0812829.1 hypothetical protein HanPSC8_Chr17g0766381 [Helianthus annuus]